jgi:hypothetical protein
MCSFVICCRALALLLLAAQAAALRNIDPLELLAFTPSALFCSAAASTYLRPGALRLLAEAEELGVLCVLTGAVPASATHLPAVLAPPPAWLNSKGPLSTAKLTRLRRALRLAPQGFGGSDGFGRAPAAGTREPMAPFTVVLVTSLEDCLAAIGAGCRAVGLPAEEGGDVEPELEGVADAILETLCEEDGALALSIDDLSTPGSFWLNPAVARDAQGHAVNPETGELVGVAISAAERGVAKERAGQQVSQFEVGAVAKDDEGKLREMLDDIAPL